MVTGPRMTFDVTAGCAEATQPSLERSRDCGADIRVLASTNA